MSVPETVSAAAPREGREPRGLRARAFLVAIPLLIGICFVSVYADMVSKTVQFGVLQLAPPAVAALFALALVNRFIAKLLRREVLSRVDILVVYVMLLVGVMVSTRGMVEKVIPPLSYLPYYANETNQFHEYITRHLPAWAMPFTPAAAMEMPDSIRRYYESLRPGESIPYGIWIGPLFAWFTLIACAILVFFSLATILRRRWMEDERLSFPLTKLPLAIINDEIEGQPFLRNRTMWLGFAVAAAVFGLNGFQANVPNLPFITVDFRVNPLFTQRPWSEMDIIALWLSLAAIGFAYFLPNDLLFSLWFFFLLTRAQDIIAVQLGGQPMSIGTHNARIWTGYQALGAYIVLIIAQLKIGWPYFRQAWQTAFERNRPGVVPLDDSNELMSYRAAFFGLFFGFAGIILWLTMAGMSPLLAAVQMGIYLFIVAVIMTRAVSEAGLLMTETSFLPNHLIRLVYPLPLLGAQNLSLMAMTDIVFTRDLRGVLLSPFMDSQKMAGEQNMRQRSLLLPLIAAIVIAFVVASYFFITFHYEEGGLNLYSYPRGNAGNMFNQARAHIRGETPEPDATAYGGLAVGVVAATALVWARTVFPWFPLHPLAYAIAPTWAMHVFFFPFFVAWIIKSIIARFGSIQMYRQFAPFMLGMILGEFAMAVFWALMSTRAIGWNAPIMPWP